MGVKIKKVTSGEEVLVDQNANEETEETTEGTDTAEDLGADTNPDQENTDENEDQETSEGDVPEVTVTDTEEESSDIIINVVDAPEVVSDVKKVKVHLKKDHKCCIGGEWYYFAEGERTTVPENVRDILLGADLLLPL